MQRLLITILAMSSWYLLDSSCRVLSNEYLCARVAVIFQVFLHHFVLAKLAHSSIGVNTILGAIWFLDYSSPSLILPSQNNPHSGCPAMRVSAWVQKGLIVQEAQWLFHAQSTYYKIISGFDFPRGPGAYAPRFCCGPLDFSDLRGPK